MSPVTTPKANLDSRFRRRERRTRRCSIDESAGVAGKVRCGGHQPERLFVAVAGDDAERSHEKRRSVPTGDR